MDMINAGTKIMRYEIVRLNGLAFPVKTRIKENRKAMENGQEIARTFIQK